MRGELTPELLHLQRDEHHCAALGALIASPKRSLAFCLIGGLAGYLLGEALL